MKENDFYDLGKRIDRVIQTAIDSNNFSELNKDVRETFEQVASTVQKPVNKTEAFIREKQRLKQEEKEKEKYLIIPGNEKTSANLMTILGFTGSAILGIAFLVLLLIHNITGGIFSILFVIPMVVIGILFAVTLTVGISGQKKLGRIGRFRQYCQILNGRTYCEVKELVSVMNRKKGFIINDLKEMIRRGMFRQGHLTDDESCFMITDEVYQQYHQAQLSYKKRQAELEAEAKKYADEKYTEEVRNLLKKGEEYVKNIRACNDAIPGVEISNKIDRLETIVANIFTQIEKNPELVSELGQFFNYYLPTTLKLLNAYRELDQQSVEGENISETKREIDRTLDTIITAFENILDNCYKDMNWDVLSDISVLNTMMAKDGLTGSDMINKKK